jgi:hypothetical protein
MNPSNDGFSRISCDTIDLEVGLSSPTRPTHSSLVATIFGIWYAIQRPFSRLFRAPFVMESHQMAVEVSDGDRESFDRTRGRISTANSSLTTATIMGLIYLIWSWIRRRFRN